MSFAIVTPSYRVDFPRCALLNESIRRYIPRHVRHYMIVPQEDFGLFHVLADDRSKILIQEHVIPKKFTLLPWPKGWRVSWTSPPIRGWIWQQIVKLTICRVISEDILMFVDSDCLFVQPFEMSMLIDNRGRAPFFREKKPFYAADKNTQSWHQTARKILKVSPPDEADDRGFVGAYGFWRRDVMLSLLEHLEEVYSSHWISRVALCKTFSEYVLYGTFVEDILGLDNAVHYLFDRHLAEDHWLEIPLSLPDLHAMQAKLTSDTYMVHINGKSHTRPTDIAQVFLT